MRRSLPILMLMLACVLRAAPPAPQPAPSAPPVQEAPLRAHLAFLADDLLEGRGPGTRGGRLAARYLEAQLQALGLKPLKGGTYRQEVLLDGIHTLAAQSRFTVRGPKGDLPVALVQEAVMNTGQPRTHLEVDAPLVFAGYGITAPEEGWDDLKGVDCAGKVLLVLCNEPLPTAEEPGRFDGANMSVHGRWARKLNQGAARGAAGVVIIHTPQGAGWPWSVAQNSFTVERLQSPERRGNPVEGWITEDLARRMFAQAGQDLDALRAQAGRRGFRPVELGLRLKGSLEARVRRVVDCNVAALLPGSDPVLKGEAVVYTAHYDHLGMKEAGRDAPAGDAIYNGAWDNASGCAALLAMAQASAARPPRRSQVFLFCCAEEVGALGSEAYARDPLWPLERTVAALNLDQPNVLGPMRDMDLPGLERTTMGPWAERAARALGVRIDPPSPDPTGGYFRSDHFSFVQAGVPALSVSWGEDFADDPARAKARLDALFATYHQASDAYLPTWRMDGLLQNAQLALELGYLLADSREKPGYMPGRLMKGMTF